MEVPWPCDGIHGVTTTESPSIALPSGSEKVSWAALSPLIGAAGDQRTSTWSRPMDETTVSKGVAGKDNAGIGPLGAEPHPPRRANSVAMPRARRLTAQPCPIASANAMRNNYA